MTAQMMLYAIRNLQESCRKVYLSTIMPQSIHQASCGWCMRQRGGWCKETGHLLSMMLRNGTAKQEEERGEDKARKGNFVWKHHPVNCILLFVTKLCCVTRRHNISGIDRYCDSAWNIDVEWNVSGAVALYRFLKGRHNRSFHGV